MNRAFFSLMMITLLSLVACALQSIPVATASVIYPAFEGYDVSASALAISPDGA